MFNGAYGSAPQLGFEPDGPGRCRIRGVRAFHCWLILPYYSKRKPTHPAGRERMPVQSGVHRPGLASPSGQGQEAGPAAWELKADPAHLDETVEESPNSRTGNTCCSFEQRKTGEPNCFVSNAASGANLKPMMSAAFAC